MSLKVSAVLTDEVYKEIETVPAFCAEIEEKRNASNLIQKLNKCFPLPSLGHLKRVKANENKLCVLLSQKGDSILSKADFEGNEDLKGLANFCEIEVPVSKPITRAQYESAKMLWPTQFHENKRLEKTLGGTLFSKEEMSSIKHYMDIAFAVCSKTDTNESPVGGVVVDPERECIIAQCSSSTSHPLKHAVMVCLDAVAVTQGGGAWVGAEKGSLLQESGAAEHLWEGGDLTDGSAPPAKKPRKSVQYLCTGYDLYITMEPCIMCAMALVHSRIGRVFYASSNLVAGGLETIFKIHVQPGLNHHFEVYSVKYL